jgi:alpha-N-arabinofuranosidase
VYYLVALNKSRTMFSIRVDRSIAMLVIASVLASAAYSHQEGAQGRITVDLAMPGHRVSKTMYGAFLEEISNSTEGGLYAELIQNRSFEDANVPFGCSVANGKLVPPRTPHFWHAERAGDWTLPWPDRGPHPAWTTQGNGKFSIGTANPLNQTNPKSMRIESGGGAELINEGFWGVNVVRGETYRFSTFVRSDTYRGEVIAQLRGTDGRTLGSSRLNVGPGGWKQLSASIRATGTDPKARLVLTFPESGTLNVDHVSLFPSKTFKNRPNGLRQDLAQMIADLKPGFVRWPGGCVVEGITVDNRPRWEKTLGPVEAREPQFVPWGYWTSNGFGYHEWLQFCEDLGAEPLYVFNAGVSCAFRSGTFTPDEDLPALIQNTLDAIEYAIGPATSKWGSVRAKSGHPKPFNMTTVEIGNEQQGPRYGARVKLFREAIKAKYPQLKVALSSWISGIDRPAIQAAGPIEIVDEHAYRPLNWAISNFDSFGRYPRDAGWELYIGEFATNNGVGRGNLMAMLNDAVYMMSMEKNADLVTMGSYAPLLENVNTPDWEVNLIHFDSSRAYGRASYHACRLFAENLPTTTLPTSFRYSPNGQQPIAGPVGLGTFSTEAEFKDVRIEIPGKPDLTPRFDSGWTHRGGRWTVEGASLVQKNGQGEFWTYFGGDYADHTVHVKARKIRGDEGFLVSVGNADGRRVQLNVGGWGNTLHAIQATDVVRNRRGKIETDRWYDMRIETKGRRVTAYLDNVQIFDETLPRTDTVIAVAGKDDSTGDVILKVVNSSSEPAAMDVELAGIAKLGRNMKVTTLRSNKPTDENTFANPDAIIPKVQRVAISRPDFRYAFPPYSLTILRIPTR